MVSALCISTFAQGAEINPHEINAAAAITIMQKDDAVKGWCNGFLSNLINASQELAASGDTSDILSVYTNEATGSADALFNNPAIVACATSLATRVYGTDGVMRAYDALSNARSKDLDLQERKTLWTTFRTIFGAKVSEVAASMVNTDDQQYWHPTTVEEQRKGARYFLEQNMHLRLTPAHTEVIRAESLLYFTSRAVQRATDLETDDQYAVLPKEAQKEWEGASE